MVDLTKSEIEVLNSFSTNAPLWRSISDVHTSRVKKTLLGRTFGKNSTIAQAFGALVSTTYVIIRSLEMKGLLTSEWEYPEYKYPRTRIYKLTILGILAQQKEAK